MSGTPSLPRPVPSADGSRFAPLALFPPFLPRFGVHSAMSVWTPCCMSLEQAGVNPHSMPSLRGKSARWGSGAFFRWTSCSFPGRWGLLFGGDGCAMLGRGPGARSRPFVCLHIHTGGDPAGLDLSDQRQVAGSLPRARHSVLAIIPATRDSGGRAGGLKAAPFCRQPRAAPRWPSPRSALGDQAWQNRQPPEGTREGWGDGAAGEGGMSATSVHDLKSKEPQGPPDPDSLCGLGGVA